MLQLYFTNIQLDCIIIHTFYGIKFQHLLRRSTKQLNIIVVTLKTGYIVKTTSKMLQYNHPVQLKCSNENMALVLHIFLYNSIIYVFNPQLRVLIGPCVGTTRLKGCPLSLWGLGCLGFALAEHLLHLLLDVLHPASPLLAHFIFVVLCNSCVAHEGDETHVEEVGDV